MASSSISSSDRRLSISKRCFKPLMLRDYLLDDLSSSSSNGFKSFPRRRLTPSSSSSTVRLFLDAEIKRSGLIHHHHNKPRRFTSKSRTTCGTAISHVVRKASTAFLNAVKLLPFPSNSPTVKSPGDDGVFSRSFSKRLLSRSFWKKQVSQSHREVSVIDGDGNGEIQWWRSAAYFPDQDQPPDLISQISTVDEATFSSSTTENNTVEVISSISGSELFTNSSEILLSYSSSSSSFASSAESEPISNQNDAVEGGENLNARDGDGSSVNGNSLCNGKEYDNEEKEQLSPVSILECPFEDDDEDEDVIISDQNDPYDQIARKSRRLNCSVQLKPLDFENHIETQEEEEHSYHVPKTEEDESENRANRLLALIKSKISETNDLLASKVADNLILDYLQEEDNNNNGVKDETLMVKKVENWVMGRQEDMFLSWEVKEKRQVYVKEMKWGCSINGDERENVVEVLAHGVLNFLVDEFIFDLGF